MFAIVIMLISTAGHGHGLKENADNLRFYYKNKNAVMPVAIRGNVKSQATILFLHGGPGGSAMLKIGSKAFNALEEKYRVVYWDQRGSGLSRGGAAKRYMNLQQFIEDLDGLVDILKDQYPEEPLLLMGHSWGGALGVAYLADATRQSKISGWIDVAGAHNNPRADSLSMIWVKEWARRQIALHRHAMYWNYALRWYERNPEFTSAQLMHYQLVKKCNGYMVNQTTADRPGANTPGKWLLKPYKMINYFKNYRCTLSRLIISELDLSSSLDEIKIPTLIVWGRSDGLIPLSLAFEAHRLYGARDCKPKLVVVDQSAHMVYYEQPEQFSETILFFIGEVLSNRISKLAQKS